MRQAAVGVCRGKDGDKEIGGHRKKEISVLELFNRVVGFIEE
jgi:hypothetical protein